MSTTPILTSSECPNCGASIDLSKVIDNQRQIECEYCGSVLNLPQPERLREIQAQTIVIKVSDPEATKTTYTPPAKKSGGAGCAFITPLLILGILGVVFWQTGMFDRLGFNTGNTKIVPQLVMGARVFGEPVPLPRINDGPQEVAYLTLNDRETQVVSVDMTQHAELWRSRSFSDNFSSITMVSDAERIYVADGDNLVALKRTNGEVAWELSLPYGVSADYQCRLNACLRVFGDRLVARLKDGTLQAMDVATGKPAWKQQLNYTSGGLYDALGNPAAVDTADGKNSAATFLEYDTTSGDVKTKIAPDCMPERGSTTLRPEYPFASDDWLISPDGKSLIVVKDGSAPCAWRFDLSRGNEIWRYTADRNADEQNKLPFMRQRPVLASDDGVFVSNGAGDAALYRLDMQTGAFSLLHTDKRYNIEPLLAHAGLVYVIAAPGFDRDKRELWAFDATTGAKKWQIGLKLKHSFDKWVLQPSDAGLFLAQTLWNDGKVLFDVIDSQTGTSKGQQSVEMQNPSLNGYAIDRNTAWLNLSAKLHEVDMNTGEVKATWP
jgi:outer membrane protein assembly factor BamB/DNA-directed RNA polymerase subunit RPC12/RpoP